MSANRFDASKVANDSKHCLSTPALLQPLMLAIGSLVLISQLANAQAPGLLWATNIGARVFAVDAQTNVYANAGGTVIVLNSAGVPLQTNAICPRPSLAVRDADGNYYFTGTLPSHLPPGSPYLVFDPQDFGGVTLSNSPVFLVKYSAAGTLLWATNFGPLASLRWIAVTDLVLDSDGNILLSYFHFTSTTTHSPIAAKFTSGGSHVWTTAVPYAHGSSPVGVVRLTSGGSANGYALHYIGSGYFRATLSRFDGNGLMTVITNWFTPYDAAAIAPRAVINSYSELYNAEGESPDNLYFVKRQPSGPVIRGFFIGNNAQRVVGPDQFDGVHVATDTGQLTRYDYDGNWVWTMNLPSNCEDLILGPQGDRFLTLSGGSVARLGAEALMAPNITTAPKGLTVLAGSNAVLNVEATGTTPLSYSWRLEGAGILNATNSTLTLSNVTVAQAGNYQVVVSNHVGSVTSSPALLRVKHVAIFDGERLLTGGTHVFSNTPTINIRSAYVNGSIFYTLDGSTPSFGSTPYTAPFTLATDTTIRALAYSADFSQSEEADVVNAIVLPRHTLAVSTSEGGRVGEYLPNCITAPPGLVASWRGEGNALDSIGTNHGIVQGTLNYTAGAVQQAFSFGGAGGIRVNPSPVLDVGLGDGFTVEFWLNWNGVVGTFFVQWNDPSNGTGYNIGYSGIVVYNSGALAAGFTLGQNLYLIESSPGLVTSNVLHHAAFTYDKATGVGRIYLDGQIVGQSSLGSFTPRTSDFVYIGMHKPSIYFPGGLLDEVSIYSRALSSSEIQSIYQAGSLGKCVPTSVEGSYLATEVLTPTATPSDGYAFLYWLGDASGPYPTINVSMERDKALHAVFGTILSTTVTGNGSVQVLPPGGVYPLGTTLRLTAIPQPGNYFGFWGNAATGNTNPLHFTLTGPNQTVSSIFAPLPADQSALTVLINGRGRVTANPRANAYPTNQSVTLTAVSDAGQSFLNWSGDASGSQNPLVVSMSQSRVITANFSGRPVLRVDRPGVEGMTPAGFRLTVVSDPQTSHEIRVSTNLTTWTGLGRVTNDFGEVQFTDTNALSTPVRFYQAAP